MSKDDIIFCPKCRKKMPIGACYCSDCGFDLRTFIQDTDKIILEAYNVKTTNPDIAFEYFRLASKNGNEIAMYELGNLYFYNLCSQTKSYPPTKRISLAQYCYTKSGKKGYEYAIDKLLYMDASPVFVINNSEAREFLNEIKQERIKQLNNERKKKEAEEQLVILRAKEEKKLQFLNDKVKEYNDLINSIIITDDIGPYVDRINSMRSFLNTNKWVRDRIIDSKKLSTIYYLVDNKNEQIRREKIEQEKRKKIERICEQEHLENERKKKENEILASFEKQYLNKTLYYEFKLSYREGVITRLKYHSLDNVYAEVYFKDTNEIKIWVLPESIIKGFVSLENKWNTKPENELTYEEKETIKEKKYLLTVIENCRQYITAKYEAEPVKYIYSNPYDEDYEPQETANEIYTATMQSFWRDISMSPFFASVKTTKYGLFYIGKQSINDLVLDWRDPRCSAYYNFSSLIANDELGLSLVRDHNIAYQKYKGFIDKFNSENEDFIKNVGFNISNLGDKYLIKLLEQSRNQKKAHDIIRTIQDNQYKIISNTNTNNMIVVGCAGSGKTMVLFHRIAYLAFNDINFKPEEFLIISSNKLLNDEADALSKELQLGSIKNIDTYGLYYDFINYYINSCNSYFKLKQGYEGIMENEKIYSIEYLENIYKTVEKFCLFKNKNFYNYYFNNIKKAFKSILKCEVNNIRDIKKAFNKYKDVFEILKSVPLGNLEIASNYKTEVSFFLKYLKKYLGEFGLLTKNGKLYKSLSEKDVPRFQDALNYSKTKQIKYKKVSYFDDRISDDAKLVFLYDLTLLLEMANNLIDYKAKKYKSLAMDIIEYVVSLDTEFALSNYSDKLFLYAYLLLKLGFVTKHKFKRIFIDEYQNYSKAELTFIKSLANDGSLNLFGDQKQKIESKGIEFDELKELGDFDVYELKVNYRNAKEICEFLNDEFDMSMISIGVSGKAQIVDRTSVKFVAEKQNGRTALIVKDLSFIDDDIKKFNTVSEDNMEIKRDEINVVPVASVKGLEFEKVYVLNRGLSENEKYLAYSRALNTLIIIKD